jgi:hypothetical protein
MSLHKSNKENIKWNIKEHLFLQKGLRINYSRMKILTLIKILFLKTIMMIMAIIIFLRIEISGETLMIITIIIFLRIEIW